MHDADSVEVLIYCYPHFASIIHSQRVQVNNYYLGN